MRLPARSARLIATRALLVSASLTATFAPRAIAVVTGRVL
jgi:hypothetical protein